MAVDVRPDSPRHLVTGQELRAIPGRRRRRPSCRRRWAPPPRGRRSRPPGHAWRPSMMTGRRSVEVVSGSGKVGQGRGPREVVGVEGGAPRTGHVQVPEHGLAAQGGEPHRARAVDGGPGGTEPVSKLATGRPSIDVVMLASRGDGRHLVPTTGIEGGGEGDVADDRELVRADGDLLEGGGGGGRRSARAGRRGSPMTPTRRAPPSRRPSRRSWVSKTSSRRSRRRPVRRTSTSPPTARSAPPIVRHGGGTVPAGQLVELGGVGAVVPDPVQFRRARIEPAPRSRRPWPGRR